jgi:redox-regulated HSP33 family molecular chaperone
LCSAAGDDGLPTVARGVLVECPPDGDDTAFARVSELFANGAAAKAIGGATLSMRTLLRKLDLPLAEVRRTAPIAFACRCSRERAQAMLDALPPADRAGLPPTVDITCHLCGRIWTVTNAH